MACSASAALLGQELEDDDYDYILTNPLYNAGPAGLVLEQLLELYPNIKPDFGKEGSPFTNPRTKFAHPNHSWAYMGSISNRTLEYYKSVLARRVPGEYVEINQGSEHCMVRSLRKTPYKVFYVAVDRNKVCLAAVPVEQ
jgi:hypothetical protein